MITQIPLLTRQCWSFPCQTGIVDGKERQLTLPVNGVHGGSLRYGVLRVRGGAWWNDGCEGKLSILKCDSVELRVKHK